MTDLCSICQKHVETCDSFGNDYLMENGNVIKCTKYLMSEEHAKHIIRNDPKGDVIQRLMAIATAEEALGNDCTMEDIWKWAET